MAAALLHRPCFINHQSPSHEGFAVACLNGAFQIRILYFSESKASRFIREPVSHYTHRASWDALVLEPRTQIRFCRAIGKITNV